MKNLIEKYSNKITKNTESIKRLNSIMPSNTETNNIDIDDLLGEIENAKADIRIYSQFIKDIKECDLIKACTELNKEDSFVDITNVASMMIRAGQVLELEANKEGKTSVIARSMKSIARKIKEALPVLK